MNKGTRRKIISWTILYFVAGMLFFLAIGWFFAEKGGVAAKWTFGISIYFFGCSSGLTLKYALSPEVLHEDLARDLDKYRSADAFIVAIPSWVVGSFLLSSFSMWKIWGTSVFAGGASNLGTWLAYLLDNLVRSLCMDFAETFYIDVSPIDHSSHFFVCLFVFIFRTTISLAIISVAYKTWVRLRTRA